MMKAGTFPKSFCLTPRKIGWLEVDIDDWLERKAGKVAA
jgi:predicted DNA-binding transcriptional regulator AlpA